MRNYFKYLLFAWHFKSVTGYWPNKEQKSMFYAVEDTVGKNILEYSRQSGVTTFIVAYAKFLWDMGDTIALIGERYLRQRASSLLDRYPFDIILTNERIPVKDRDCVLIDDSNTNPFEGDLGNLSWLAEKVILIRTK